MNLFDLHIEAGLERAAKIGSKFAPAWEGLPPADAAAFANYFLPHKSAKNLLSPTRPRVIKWYCPFANQRDFPTGIRYCINLYSGCSHDCVYCYAAGYSPENAACKRDFEKMLARDLADMEKFNTPPAAVHLSNSTDPFQPLELQAGHTKLALQKLLEHRKRFSSIVLLTKNPAIAANDDYIKLLLELNSLSKQHPCYEKFKQANLPGVRVEISLAFLDDPARKFFDPAAPTVANRLEAIAKLRAAGVPVVLRIDPLLPRAPLPGSLSHRDFSLPAAQSLQNLNALVKFAADQGIMQIVYSVAKIPQPRYRKMPGKMQNLKQLYEYLASPQKLIYRGGSYRLPHQVLMQHVVEPFLEITRQHNMPTFFCKDNLLSTP